VNVDRRKLVDYLFQSALARPVWERDAFLREACAGDEALDREVRLLLAAHDKAGSFLDCTAIEEAAREGLSDSTVTHLQTDVPSDLSGHIVSQYKILERLGAGGMGVVYKARDTKLDRLVALKFLPQNVSHNKELKARLIDEARAASALDHPNILVIYDIGEAASGELFIAMAYHQGATLQERIRTGLPVAEALQIARQIALGLAKAHEHGIFHRDIKPSNVIVASDGIARIIDFGLAKTSDATVTADGSTKGTPLYMSPEQATGKAVDFRTDLWSLGAVLFEMLAGRPPFRGDGQLPVMRAIAHDNPPNLRDLQPGLPAGIEAIVSRALQKDPAKRYQSAADMARDLSTALATLDGPARQRTGLRAAYAIPALAAILLVAGAAVWFYHRSEKRHWAREQAIPEIARLKTQNKPLAAFLLMREAERYLPADPQLTQIAEGLTHDVAVRSSPPGASVEIKDYLSPGDAWFPLGATPLAHVKIPNGYLRWRISKPGVGEFTAAPVPDGIHGYLHEFNFPLDAAAAAPQGMVPVPAVQAFSFVWALGSLGPFNFPVFYIDRFEVTNRQYQKFVDQGGYRKREYWKEKFIQDGRELTWEQATDLLRDSSGRPGPSTWEAGHYPAGQADYPVGGVSWYEASAYAEFAGKSLPVIAQWYWAAPSSVAKYVIAQSNFSTAAGPDGKYQGLGPFGTYDMAGSVAEWCRNESGSGGARYQLGGGFNTSPSEYFEPQGLPPFHRAANAGFRCVKNTAPLPAEAAAERRLTIRDFSKARPASDAVFRIYKDMYAYDRTPLNSKVESVAQDSPDWRKEKITFDAAYGKERVTAYLFLPTRVKPPFQTVAFYPSGRALDAPSSETLEDMKFFDYVIRSGRAVLYPVYKGTYERTAPEPGPDTTAGRETLIQDSKDLGRSLDYLETRPDIDRNRFAYMGESMGAALGVNLAGVEDRFKAVIFTDGGFMSGKMLPGTDQADFAPHVKAPTLMVAGRFDWIFLGKDALLNMLGAPASKKQKVILETAHDVSEQRADLVREVVAWLDKYLGKVE
jgi:eukaryotic-like serine/threonine-protein kinase